MPSSCKRYCRPQPYYNENKLGLTAPHAYLRWAAGCWLRYFSLLALRAITQTMPADAGTGTGTGNSVRQKHCAVTSTWVGLRQRKRHETGTSTNLIEGVPISGILNLSNVQCLASCIQVLRQAFPLSCILHDLHTKMKQNT